MGGKKLLLMTDCDDWSALHAAAAYGHVESMRQLIEAGGMELVLLGTKRGRTALHIAARTGLEATARVLIKAGGKELLFATCIEGWSVLTLLH